eukprot:6034991-Prymnesium_polylepis.1
MRQWVRAWRGGGRRPGSAPDSQDEAVDSQDEVTGPSVASRLGTKFRGGAIERGHASAPIRWAPP